MGSKGPGSGDIQGNAGGGGGEQEGRGCGVANIKIATDSFRRFVLSLLFRAKDGRNNVSVYATPSDYHRSLTLSGRRSLRSLLGNIICFGVVSSPFRRHG